jgi:hypothetical protein
MDMAILNHSLRPHYLSAVNKMLMPSFEEYFFDWIILRNIIPQEVKYSYSFCHESINLSKLLHLSRVHLKTLILSDIADDCFRELGPFPALISFNLSCVQTPVSANSLMNFWSHHPQLQKLSLSFTQGFNSKLIVSLVSKCPNLKQLSLSYNQWFNDECVMKLVQGGLNLLSLNIRHSSVRLKKSLELILASFPNLHSFSIYDCNFSLETREFYMRQVAIPSLLSDDPEIQSMGLNCIYAHFEILTSSECSEFPIEDDTFSSIVWGVIPILQHPNQVDILYLEGSFLHFVGSQKKRSRTSSDCLHHLCVP